MLVHSSERRQNKQVLFRLNSGKEVVGTMDGPQISGLGGIILLGELEKTLSLIRQAAASLHDWRQRPTYSLYFLLLQRVLLICAGLEDGIDSNYHRYDPAVLTALGLNISAEKLASQPTLSVMENKLGAKNCYRLAMFLLTFYIASRRSIPKEIVLDFDGSCFPVHGDQQGSCYRGHYETDMYFPLLVFDQDGWLITAILRPGNHGEARIVIPVLRRIVPAFRKAWPGVRIIVRADAGFNDPNIYDWCEDQGENNPEDTLYYVIRMKRHPRDNGIDALIKRNKIRVKRTFRRRFGTEKYLGDAGKRQKNEDQTEILKLSKEQRKKELARMAARKVRGYCELFYCAGMGRKQWRRDRRVIAVLDHLDTGDEQMYLVTNIQQDPPRYLYEEKYCQRGKAEYFIHELKSLHATRLSCQDFWANQFRLLEHTLAYLLLFKLRELLPPESRRMSLSSVRENIVKVAVVVREYSRKTVVQWTSHYFWKKPFLAVCRQLERMPMRC